MKDVALGTLNFYRDLPMSDRFIDVANPEHYTQMPNDWHVIITDVRGSTKAIEAGRYKEVNIVGAASIAALLHAVGDVDVPFVFGGDGATFVVPSQLLETAKVALAGAKARAKAAFGMDLRVGLISIREVEAAGHTVKVSKFKISKHYAQAMFMGGGLSYAEKVIKHPELGVNYLLDDLADLPDEELKGLECRWQDVVSRYGETVSLLVKAVAGDEMSDNDVYSMVIAKVEEIYGDVPTHHPIAAEKLNLSQDRTVLMREVEIRKGASSPFVKKLYYIKLRLFSWGVNLLTRWHLFPGDLELSRYKHILIRSTDYKKFDDTLRMLISGNSLQRAKLEAFLLELYKDKKIVYGVHVSDRALMTCLVFETYGRQVHFVDGADGGYTLASKQLKAQLA